MSVRGLATGRDPGVARTPAEQEIYGEPSAQRPVRNHLTSECRGEDQTDPHKRDNNADHNRDSFAPFSGRKKAPVEPRGRTCSPNSMSDYDRKNRPNWGGSADTSRQRAQ